MEKMEFHFELNETQQKQKQVRYETLKQNALIKSWLERNHLDEMFLYDHSIKMEALAKRYETCQNCKGLHQCDETNVGYILDLVYDHILLEKLTPCRYKRRELEELAHRSQYLLCDLSDAQLKIDLNKIDFGKESADYKQMIKDVLLKLKQNEKGVYLYGKPGVGKTYIAAGIANHYAKQGMTIAFVNVMKLIGDLKQLFQDHDAMEKRIRQLSTVPVLILDDIGGENISKWSRDEILLPILNERMEAGLFTCFTSNYSFQELYEQYENAGGMKEPMNALRFMERMKALSCEIFVKGESRR